MRCFIGSFLNVSNLSKVQNLVPNLDDVRWVRPERYHVTLEFFGDLLDEGVPEQLARVRSLSKSFPITTESVTVSGFPTAPRSRVVVILLGSNGKFESLYPTNPNFKPHITLGYSRAAPARVTEQFVRLELLFEDVGLYESRNGEYIQLGV